MKTTEEMIKVMQAFIDGKQIQYCEHGDSIWFDVNIKKVPSWQWHINDYRIKPEQEMVPLDFSDRLSLINEVAVDSKGELFHIQSVHKLVVGITSEYIDYKELFNEYTKLDGSKFGKFLN